MKSCFYITLILYTDLPNKGTLTYCDTIECKHTKKCRIVVENTLK